MTENNKKVSETSSGEVVNGFRSCRDLSDVVPLYSARGLYLKPVAKVNVSVNLPQLKTPGNTISTWEVMEKIRMLIRPDEFASLKVVKSTLEFIRLEGDLRDRCRLQRVLARLESQRLNLAGFSNILKVRAAEAKDDFPTRHSWDSYFRDAKHMNELKAGERPDTIHIQGLPVKWFSEDGKTPDESMVAKIFKKWGTLRRIDVPAADPYRSKMRLGSNIQKFSFGDGIFFDAYIQYIEYMDFLKAMDSLRGMKLMKKEGQNYLTAVLKVDFDKTKHMSDSSVSQREFERKRLIAQDNLAAEKQRRKEEAEVRKREEQKKREEIELTEKESRRRKREDKRKRKALTVFRKQEEDKVSMKIAREERKLIKAQRQLESIRLLDELFDRIKIKIEKKEIEIKPKDNSKDGGRDNDEKLDDLKKDKKDKKAKKKKNKREKKKKKKKKRSGSSSNSDSETKKKKIKSVLTRNISHEIRPGPPMDPVMSYAPMYPRFQQPWYYDHALPMLYSSMGRGGRGGRFIRNRGRGNSQRRFMNNRSLRGFNPHLYNEQYYKYFANLAGQDYHTFESECDRSSRSRSRSRRRSNSRSRSKSRSRSNRRRRNRSDNHSRSRTNSRSRTKSKSRSRSKSRNRSRSKRRNRIRSRSRSRTRSKSRSRSRTKSKSRSRRSKRSAHSRSHSRSRRSSRSKRTRRRSESQVKITRAKSRTTSLNRRSRSSTWSLPKSPRQRSCSWSKEADNADIERKQKEKGQKKGDGDQKTNKESKSAENKESNNKERSNKEIINEERGSKESNKKEDDKKESDKKDSRERNQKDSKKESNKDESKKNVSKKERSEGTKESSKDETRSEALAL